MKPLRYAFFCICIFLAANFSPIYAQLNMTLTGQLAYNEGINDIWGYTDPSGNEYALVGTQTGVSIVDISTTPSTPTELHFIPGVNNNWRDLKTWGTHAYVVNESPSGGGLLIIDLSGLPGAITTSTTNLGIGYTDSHNIFIDENGIGYLFGAYTGTVGNGTIICDINANPTNPTYLGIYNTNYVHDGFVRGDTMWTSEIYAGQLGVVDVTNKAAPVLLSSQPSPKSFAHACWLSDDGNYIFLVDEKSDAWVTAYDVSDIYDIKELDRWQSFPGTNVVPHNTFVLGNFVVNSYYTSGVVVLDATYPDNLIEIANYDTSIGYSGNGYFGDWGVYPYFATGTIIASDRQEGLHVFSHTFTQACYLEGVITDMNTGAVIPNAAVEIVGVSSSIDNTDFLGIYKTGAATVGTYTVNVTATGYYPGTATVILSANGTITYLDIELTPIPACTFAPVNVTHTNLTDVSVLVTWDADPNAIAYNIQYRPVGSTTWTSTTSPLNNVTLSGLTPATPYEIEIEIDCGSGVVSPFSVTHNFTTYASCAAPVITFGTITETTAVFNWTAISTANDYTIRYRPLGASAWTGNNANALTIGANGLQGCTDYEVQIRSNCTGFSGGYSVIYNFTTTAPDATWTGGASLLTCDAAINLNSQVTGNSGGTWTGTGVSTTGTFNPIGLTAGTYPITYTVGTGTCLGTDVQNITVSAAPDPSWTPTSLQDCDASIDLNTLVVGTNGGSWTGTGVNTTGIFDPSNLASGIYPIAYTVGTGSCQFTSNQNITITTAPDASWTGTSLVECDVAIDLNPQVTGTSGGTWTGTGVSTSGMFNPSGLTAGNYPITYTVGIGTCQFSTNQNIIVTAAPDPSWTGVSLAECDAAIDLNPQVTGTSGGSWTGTGVSTSGMFDPSGLTAGTYPITYTVGTGSCQFTNNQNITVTAAPDASWTGTSIVECDAAIDLNLQVTGNSGGTWSGTGVNTSGMFNLSGLTAGTYPITYTVGTGTCQFSTNENITVTTAPDASWTGTSLAACDAAIDLNPQVSGTSGGAWTGTGVSASGMFDPSGLTAGTYPITYTVGTGTCQFSTNENITITAAPDASWTGISLAECDAIIDLNPQVNGTSGGAWIGTGVSASGMFDPSGLAAGTYPITYTVGTGTCQFSTNENIIVTASPDATWTGTSLVECDAAIDLNLQVTGNSGGAWTGTGVSAAGMFDPSGLAAGTYPITYTVGTGTCQFSTNENITVTAAPDASWTGTSLATCDAVLDLNPQVTGTIGGTWTGTGVSASGMFDPSGLTAGTYPITYTVGTSTCQFSTNENITITAAPDASWTGTSLATCDATLDLNLQVSGTSGGAWTGTGVSASGMFDPSGLTAGTYPITYTVGTGTCQFSANQNITITTAPNASWTSTSVAECAPSIDLNALVNGTSGGTWSGTGVNSSDMFNPSGLAPGTYPVTYTVGTGTCEFTSTENIMVIAAPNAAWTPLVLATCDSTVDLNTWVTGTNGGTWTGSTLIGSSSFDPRTLAVGNYTLTYTVGTGTCQNAVSQTITVVAGPDPTWSGGFDIAVCDASIDLNTMVTGTSGGTWSGGSVGTNGIFDPSIYPFGAYSITYSVGTGSCSTSTSQTITVIASPSAAWNNTINIAECDNPIDLNALVTGTSGGTWSGSGVNAAGIFDPSGMSVGAYSITYSVGGGLCQDVVGGIITVASGPDASWTLQNLETCDTAIDLNTLVTGTSGGSWSGTGVTNAGVFNPAILAPGNYSITYTTGSSPCQDILNQTIVLEDCSGLLQVKVFLEGPYDATSGMMVNGINVNGLLPLSQPYNTAPWDYAGTETLSSISTDMIDWVLVEVRNGVDNNIVEFQSAAILLADGSIVDVQGNAGIKLNNLPITDDYYIVVRHRNHLDVLSNTSITFAPTTSYDFTTNITQAYGPSQLKEMSDGVSVLHTGDINGDGVITVNDFNNYVIEVSGLNQYLNSDLNLDRAVTVFDFNYYRFNASKIGVQQIRY